MQNPHNEDRYQIVMLSDVMACGFEVDGQALERGKLQHEAGNVPYSQAIHSITN